MPTPSKLHLDVAQHLYSRFVCDAAYCDEDPDHEGISRDEIGQILADSFPDPQPSSVDANLLAALRKLLQTHSCDTGEADHRCEWDAKGENTLCEMCKPAYAAI